MIPIVLLAISIVLFLILVQNIRIVPSQTVLVVERLGRYSHTLEAGFHLLFPILDRVAYRHTLKEIAIDVPSQPAFTADNVRVWIDGVLYLRVVDPRKASYSVDNYRLAAVQLAQTTMRSVVGLMELDRPFEERENINARILKSINDACAEWGVQVTRYEIQNIKVPQNILKVMEVQMKAERDKRANIARSVDEMVSRINTSAGAMEEAINRSEGEKQRLINEAQGRAEEILALSRAIASSIELLAGVVTRPGGKEAVRLQNAEMFLDTLTKAAETSPRVVLPLNLPQPDEVLRSILRAEAVWGNSPSVSPPPKG